MNRSSATSIISFKRLTLATVMLLSSLSASIIHAGEYREIENPKNQQNGLFHDTWKLQYEADDFSDEIKSATLLYIPPDYRRDKAYLLRCKEYFSNFSVKYLDHEDSLKNSDGSLSNASASFAKHGYLYDDKQTLQVDNQTQQARFRVSVGGQNRNIFKLFKTDIEATPGLLGMSWHYSFTYQEMPDFKADSNDSDTQQFYQLLKQALATEKPIDFQLESDQGHQHRFQLDTARLKKFAPSEVLDFCISERKLRQ